LALYHWDDACGECNVTSFAYFILEALGSCRLLAVDERLPAPKEPWREGMGVIMNVVNETLNL
jgi:hypothetical protein